MTTLGVGLIGCGNISSSYLRLAPLFKGVEIRAVADRDMTAAGARAEEFGVAARTVDALLASDDIDMVVNLTIPEAHFEITCRILEAGKHAYSEKPLVLTMEEGETLRALAEAKGLRVGSAPDTFLGGAHQWARHLIDAGSVGRITAGTAHIMNRGMENWHPNPDFFFQPGAGPMLDIGPYYVTNLIQLLGPVARVAALTNAAFLEREITSEPRAGEMVSVNTPTNIHALLDFVSGASVTISTSWDVHAHRHGHMELYGTEGSLFLPDPNFFGGTVERGVLGQEIAATEAWDHPFAVANQDTRANYRMAGLADMAAALIEGRDHRCSLDLALHAVDVMTSVLRSGESGAFEAMTTTCARPAALGPDEAQALLR
ncbi:MAG: Gfo/Idh/MocA family protein [Paracoccaceae bacterium]